MKAVQTSIIAGLAFLLFTGISIGADLDDIDFTIRVIGSDDVGEMHNELLLPDMIFETVDNGADHENRNGAGEHENEMEARDEREDEIEDHDEAREDHDDVNDERDEIHEEEHDKERESHEDEHERESD